MAISSLEYLAFLSLRQNNAFPPKPKVLELGESNWYGDVPLDRLTNDIEKYIADPALRTQLKDNLREIAAAQRTNILYEIARIFFRTFTDFSSYDSIDPGTPTSKYPFDLNLPLAISERFDVVANIGTGEHVFNVFQFYKSMHELTLPGGVMIHSAPCTGWPNHGFYNFQPTFFYDLARANAYEILYVVFARIQPFEFVQPQNQDHAVRLLSEKKVPQESMISVAFRKNPTPREFLAPFQGYYLGALSPESSQAWHDLRR